MQGPAGHVHAFSMVMTTAPLASLEPLQMVCVKARWFLQQKRMRKVLSSSE